MIKKMKETPKMNGDITLELPDGYTFNPHFTEEVSITLYDEELRTNCLEHKFNNKYKKLVALVISILQSDDATDSDFEIALGEVEKQKEIVLNKYFKYLHMQEKENYLKKLTYLEMELKKKYYARQEYFAREGKSR